MGVVSVFFDNDPIHQSRIVTKISPLFDFRNSNTHTLRLRGYSGYDGRQDALYHGANNRKRVFQCPKNQIKQRIIRIDL